jgi:hypothetical protein
MSRTALLLAVGLSLLTTSAVAQNCDGFTDVLASSPFCPDVTWMKTYGITRGCTASTYCPNDSVTRLQMAAFMHRLGNNPAFVNGGNAFGTTAVLGTTDNQPLTVLVNNQPTLRLIPATDSMDTNTVNVINGSPLNLIDSGIVAATIAGGGRNYLGTAEPNHVTQNYATIGGGIDNTAGFASTVAGGYFNTASGNVSTVAGGQINIASGDNSTVAGGIGNSAAGANSFAAGSNAQATHDGSFVWGDGTQAANSIGVNSFAVLATGGIGFFPGNGSVSVVFGNGNNCTLTGASSFWGCTSDRNRKENFEVVDGGDILQRVATMPLTRWNFKGHPETPHIGPVAQDFHAAFGLGDQLDDKHIDAGDAIGVTLAAIQGLNAKVDEQTTLLQSRLESAVQTIQNQQREIAELSERVLKAESLAADVVALKAALAEMQRGRETVAVK